MHRVNNGTSTPSGAASAGVGTSAIGSPIITTLSSAWITANIKVGYWVKIDKGFADITQAYEVLAIGATSITLSVNANAVETDIVVTPFANMYTDGNGGAYARTVIDALEKNVVQEEIANVIESAGFALSDTNNTQLLDSVVKKTGDIMTGDLEISVGNVVKTDSVDPTSPSGSVSFSTNTNHNDGISTNKIKSRTGTDININDNLSIAASNLIETDTITEKTSGNGVNIDYVTLKDGSIQTTDSALSVTDHPAFRLWHSTGTTTASSSTDIALPALIDADKIIAVDVYVQVLGGTSWIKSGNNVVDNFFDITIKPTHIDLTAVGSNLQSQQYRVTIIYQV